MKVNIKRGATQIGGSAVEITANNGDRIVLDIGMPLDAETNTPELLPDIRGLRDKTDDLLGIFISHGHPDHFALGKWIDKKIPVYMSGVGANILRITATHLNPKGLDYFAFERVQPLTDKTPVTIGAFTVTPFAVDHAAYDSFAFLITADNKKLFYTGDFRAHGRTAGKTYTLMRNPPTDVDVMLMEGSSLERVNPDEHFETEGDLEKHLIEIYKSTPGIVMVHQSSHNIDRTVSVFRAALQTGRTLVLMEYTDDIMKSTGNNKLPNADWNRVMKIAFNPATPNEISPWTIAKNPNKYVAIIGSYPRELIRANLLNSDATYVYSMWDGYRDDSAKKTIDLMTAHGVQMAAAHTSGHADIPTLRKMVAAIKPRVLVPIHTFRPDRFSELFGDLASVEMHDNNTDFAVK